MILEYRITVFDLIDKLQYVSHAGATRCTHTKAQAHALAPLFEKALDPFRCRFCQNSTISQVRLGGGARVPGDDLPPDALVSLARQYGCKTIAYTYTEPTVYYEYAYDSALLAADNGILNVFVTNGFISEEPLRQIAPVLHAANVDLKGWDEDFYKKIVGGRLQPILSTLKLMKELGIWVEVTTLIIPGWNDSPEELRQIAQFIASVDPSMVWHVSAFYPTYKMNDRPPTPLSSLELAREIGLEAGLKFVYEGNLATDDGETTRCPSCGEPVIRRRRYTILENRLEEGGRCPACGSTVPGYWS